MSLPQFRTCLRYTKYAAGTVFVASMTSAWYYRPLADNTSSSSSSSTSKGKGQTTASNNNQQQQQQTNNNNRRDNETFCAPYTSPPWSRQHVPLLLEWARSISIGATTLAIRLLMNTYGKYEIKDDVHYQHFLQMALRDKTNSTTRGNDRGTNQGMITVSNHRSLFDDPGIVSCLLPLPIAIQPRYNRWAICSQEYCFNDALPGIVKGYIGAGQVLPICRGGGLDQKLFLDFSRHLACGEWCHLFPEGGVWQWDELGGRRELPKNAVMSASSDFATNNANTNNTNGNNDNVTKIAPATLKQKALPPSKIGKLKWGVGKMIAHAPITPKVIPFAHHGMERLLPQDENSGKTKLRNNLLHSMLPSIFGGDANDKLHVRVQFGEEITFDDLIQDHEVKHGRLWKYCGKLNAEEQYDKGEQHVEEARFHEMWHSSAEERILYSKIVHRIEDRLDVITKEVCEGG